MSKPYRISGSRSAAILGISPYKTIQEVWMEILEEEKPGFCKLMGYELPTPPEGSQLEWGSGFESEIIDYVSKNNHLIITDREKSFINHDICSCHVDGIVKHPHGDDENLENKTTSIYYFKDNFGEAGTDKVPINYQSQNQHNMICTENKSTLMPVLIFPKRTQEFENDEIFLDSIDKTLWVAALAEMGNLKYYKIDENKKTQEIMLDKYFDFWKVNIQGEKRPDPVSVDDIKLIFREPIGTVIATEQVERWHDEISQCNSEIKELKKRAEQLKKLNLEYLLEKSLKKEYVIDDDSQEKIIMLDGCGKKIHSYYADKNGKLCFR